MVPRAATIADVFDPRHNALNAIRLLMAVMVIFMHAFPLTTGHEYEFGPFQTTGDLPVSGFFAISGYLITSSWYRAPHARHYLGARLLRLFPAFWVCLILTAFVIAPIGLRLQDAAVRGHITLADQIHYVLVNCTMLHFRFPIGTTPDNVPFPHTWNGSLWTLTWELGCYLGILALGLIGLLRRSWTLPVCFAAAWLLLVATSVQHTGGQIAAAAQLGTMFLAGAVLFQYRARIPASWPLAAAALVVTAFAYYLPDFRIIGAFTFTYVVIVVGALAKHPRLRLKNDISYGTYIYAFPIQQVLVLGGICTGIPLLFGALATAITLPIAAASWFLIEKPANKLKARL